MVSTKEKINEKMKNSGVPWIGEIPFNWYVTKFKYLVNLYTGNSISDNEKSKYEDMINAKPYISSKDINKIYSTVDYDNGLYIKNDDDSFEVAHEGDTLMCIEGGSAGIKKALLKHDVCFVNKLCCFSAKNRLLNDKYLYYFIFSPSYENYFLSKISGLIGEVSVNELKTFNICCPAIDEQGKIADFLDSKCQKIDDTIEKINKQIEILKKYKQSLITEVVTKGLDKNAPMKDSGVPWIGKICSNWEIGKIGYYYEIKLGKMIDSNIYDDNEMCNYLCAANIKWSGVDLSVNKKMKFTKEEQTQYLLKNGDVLITEGGSVGTACIYHDEFSPCYIQNSVHRCRGKNGNVTKFLYYWMNAVDYLEYILSICNKATIMHYTEEKLKKTPIIVMPIVMQQKIVDYLDNKCSKIDFIIGKKSKQIEILERYKKSLIYEYVTGKKRV